MNLVHGMNEHLLPLHVCYGAAGRASDEAFSLQIFDKQASMLLWNAVLQDSCMEKHVSVNQLLA